jgi:hypothetical protein
VRVVNLHDHFTITSRQNPSSQQLCAELLAQFSSSAIADTQGVTRDQSTDTCSPLLRLLRHVSLWWYYRVTLDPLEQLVALSSSYELLFQLMTPHQQLSCMADILLVLACPALQDKRCACCCNGFGQALT